MLAQFISKSSTIFQHFLAKILPPTCIICRLPSQSALDLCAECEQELPTLNTVCGQCALPLQDVGTTKVCGQCLQHPPLFNRTIALHYYAAPIDRMINELKFQHRLANATVLGQLLTKKICAAYATEKWPDLIIPIPLHKKRLRERGFNQSLEIAKSVGTQLNLPIDKFNCLRIRDTLPQSQLTAKERQKNLRDAFRVKNKIHAKHVAVLDDVMTTGSTINEFCRCLLNAGIEKIDVWCVARTVI